MEQRGNFGCRDVIFYAYDLPARLARQAVQNNPE
jgi:hypothetical protein